MCVTDVNAIENEAPSVLKTMLRDAGLSATSLRLGILRCLIAARRPLSHAEIQNDMPGLDRVTLYRTLSAFVEADIAHQVQGLDGVLRFCAHTKREGCPANHPHFLCTLCGAMICLDNQAMPRIDIPDDCVIEGKQFVAYGKCPECARKDRIKK
ncbi:transcriptional regulator [Synergistales bacterium]|nr:transcriptional regulator [Synergistales bacterium]